MPPSGPIDSNTAGEQLSFGEGRLRLSFTGHQTFPFRYSWLPKGVRGVKDDPKLFSREDALVRLGVGKNMVDAIRHWCEALGLITIDGSSQTAALTSLGSLLFGRDRRSKGKDPYLEDPGTLWLLHWQLVARPQMASTWHLAFTCWGRNSFTRDALAKWVLKVAKTSTATRSNANSIKRDVDVFLRTYVPVEQDRRRPIEESFDCPLGELGLIRQLEGGVYEFNQGPKSLPTEILAYAVLDWWATTAPSQETINVERLRFDPGSPGAVFKLSDQALVAMLEKIPPGWGLRYDETAGLRVLIRTSRERFEQPSTCLYDFYGPN